MISRNRLLPLAAVIILGGLNLAAMATSATLNMPCPTLETLK
ncbi:hypothetical protein [uncultured Pelagimonas sp.]|nr:hypothetical protein [uncultured Pelagimonas sp.]